MSSVLQLALKHLDELSHGTRAPPGQWAAWPSWDNWDAWDAGTEK
jgi:hypothetical protein